MATTYVVGLIIVAITLRLEPGDRRFYPAALGLAATWGIGAFLSRPIPLVATRGPGSGAARQVGRAFALGALLLAVFLAAALAVGRIDGLREPVVELLDHARLGSLPAVLALTVLNGVVEELYFRGALHDVLPARRAVVGGTLLYAVTTVGTGVPLLVVAAIAIGFVTSQQRRATGGVLGPIVTHITWSTGMLLLLPTVLQVSE